MFSLDSFHMCRMSTTVAVVWVCQARLRTNKDQPVSKRRGRSTNQRTIQLHCNEQQRWDLQSWKHIHKDPKIPRVSSQSSSEGGGRAAHDPPECKHVCQWLSLVRVYQWIDDSADTNPRAGATTKEKTRHVIRRMFTTCFLWIFFTCVGWVRM